MLMLRSALAPFAFFFVISSSVPIAARAYEDRSTAELRESIASEHPAAYYILAARLFDEGARDEAVFWFYAGQLRYRVHLECNPELPTDGDPALFAAFSDVIGSDINQYAFGDVPRLMGILEDVIAWDAETAAYSTDCRPQYQKVLAGLEELIDYLRLNGADIRAERLANGLDNR